MFPQYIFIYICCLYFIDSIYCVDSVDFIDSISYIDVIDFIDAIDSIDCIDSITLIDFIYFIKSIDSIDFIEFLHLHENKPNYRYQPLICIFYHQNKTNKFCKHYQFQFYAIYCFFILCLIMFLLNKKLTYFLSLLFWTTLLLTTLACLIFSPSTTIKGTVMQIWKSQNHVHSYSCKNTTLKISHS